MASRIGGERVPVTGRGRGDAPDIRHEWLAIEYKHWKRGKIPQWLKNAVAQAVASVRGDHQLPIAILHTTGERHDDDLVVMRLRDFEEWFGGEL